jgi:hypothetical protein
MGMWQDGRQFLVVVGTSRAECLELFAGALDAYDYSDLEVIDSFWLEHWEVFEDEETPDWIPLEIVPKRPVMIRKSRAAARHAQCA